MTDDDDLVYPPVGELLHRWSDCPDMMTVADLDAILRVTEPPLSSPKEVVWAWSPFEVAPPRVVLAFRWSAGEAEALSEAAVRVILACRLEVMNEPLSSAKPAPGGGHEIVHLLERPLVVTPNMLVQAFLEAPNGERTPVRVDAYARLVSPAFVMEFYFEAMRRPARAETKTKVVE